MKRTLIILLALSSFFTGPALHAQASDSLFKCTCLGKMLTGIPVGCGDGGIASIRNGVVKNLPAWKLPYHLSWLDFSHMERLINHGVPQHDQRTGWKCEPQ